MGKKKQIPMPKYDPVSFRLAGADMRLDNGMIKGNFHPICLSLWKCIIGFHRQISINMNAESVSYHVWDPKSRQYHTIIPYQKTSVHGLSVSVNWEDSRNKQLLDEYGKRFERDFFPACTIHTHVDSGAFESGTDARDEEENPGWHITLGNLVSKEKFDLDFRMRLPQSKKLKEFVNTGAKVNLKKEHLFQDCSKHEEEILSCPGTEDWHHMIRRVEKK